MCGGTQELLGGYLPQIGLSPRVRGNQDSPFDDVRLVRSIPACAGEPLSTACPHGDAEVYPRVCGGTQPAASRAG